MILGKENGFFRYRRRMLGFNVFVGTESGRKKRFRFKMIVILVGIIIIEKKSK